jgi:dihydrofolate reductase
MLIYSMNVSVDGFIADREGAFGWTIPSDELFRFHTALISELGGYLFGRRLYETMLAWETDPSLRENELGAAFADVWCAIPKVVFSHTLDSVQGTARLAEASLAEEIAAALDATDKDVSIGGAGLAAQAIELGLVDELRMFRYPVVVGWRHAVPAAGQRRRPAGPDRDQDVRLARDLRALRARPRRVGVTPPASSVRRLHRQSTGALTSRAAFPLTAPTFAIAWRPQRDGGGRDCCIPCGGASLPNDAPSRPTRKSTYPALVSPPVALALDVFARSVYSTVTISWPGASSHTF